MDNVTSFSEMLQGYITSEMKTCGKPNCKCARGELHGPYYYLRGRFDGEHWRQYVSKKDLPDVTRRCEAYRQFQAELAAGRAKHRAVMAQMTVMIRNRWPNEAA